MSTFLSTSAISQVNLSLIRRDFFDGMSILLQDEDGNPFNLNDVYVCSAVWKKTDATTFTKILDVNVEKQEPLDAGRIRIWLTSAQTAAIWDQYDDPFVVGGVFFPSTYSNDLSVPSYSLFWDVRIETQQKLSDLISVASGVFVSQTNHQLASSERVVFSGTTASGINYDGTSGTIYSGLTAISYQAPYSFTISSLSGITDANLGGSVYRLKQDTVINGGVTIDTTLSNCFP